MKEVSLKDKDDEKNDVAICQILSDNSEESGIPQEGSYSSEVHQGVTETVTTRHEAVVVAKVVKEGTNSKPLPFQKEGRTVVSSERSSQEAMLPGAVRVPGFSPGVSNDDTLATDPPSEQISGSEVKPSRKRSVTLGVTVSNEDLEQEIRNEILRDAVYATNVQQEPATKGTPTQQWRWIGFSALILVIGVVVVAIVFACKDRSRKGAHPPSPTVAPTNTISDTEQTYFDYFSSKMVDGGTSLRDPDSVYAQVFQRVIDDPFHETILHEYIKFILVVLFETTGGEMWINNDLWNDTSASLCDWYGVTCWFELGENRFDLVVSHLKLPNNNLRGKLDTQLASLPWNILDLSENHLTGTIPEAYKELSGFTLMDFSGNLLEGTVPPSLCDVAFAGEIRVDCDSVECSCCKPSCSAGNA